MSEARRRGEGTSGRRDEWWAEWDEGSTGRGKIGARGQAAGGTRVGLSGEERDEGTSGRGRPGATMTGDEDGDGDRDGDSWIPGQRYPLATSSVGDGRRVRQRPGAGATAAMGDDVRGR